MDARSFITNKHNAAVEELRALEAEYLPRRQAALASIALTQQFLDELSATTSEADDVRMAIVESPSSLIEESQVHEDDSDPEPRTPTSWVSARDLLPKVRQTA